MGHVRGEMVAKEIDRDSYQGNKYHYTRVRGEVKCE